MRPFHCFRLYHGDVDDPYCNEVRWALSVIVCPIT